MANFVCKHGLNGIWISGDKGTVRMCGWSDMFLGNLTDNTIEELWHSEKAELFRKSMLDGSYRFCQKGKCPYCANEELEEQFTEYVVPEYPKSCSIGYQMQCNYTCVFCRNKPYHEKDGEIDNYRKIEKEISKIIPQLDVISANGAGEIYCSNSIMNLMIDNRLREDAMVLIETNGSLFNERNWKKIEKLGERYLSVAVTVHSFEEPTYQYLSGTKLPVKNIIDNLSFISRLREKGIINRLEIATVICDRNFREMPSFVKRCLDDYSMDTIRLRFFEPYGVEDVLTEWFHDVRNEKHPYHDEFIRIMNDPIFLNEKVWKWQGDKPSLQSDSPYALEHRTTMDISRMITDERIWDSVKTWLDKKEIQRVALYGASKIGRAYHKLFAEHGITINTIFDTYEKENSYNDYSVVRPCEDNLKNIDLIIITTNTFARNIRENLGKLRYRGLTCVMEDIIEIQKSKGCLE